MKTVYICMHCGSDNVQVKSWTRPNNNNEYVDEVEGDGMGWCCDEQLVADIQTAELRDDAKVIGFQVVGMEEHENEGAIHHLMDASFCVYNLKQAHQMLQDDNTLYSGEWRLLTIWEGDVEEPTMMFSGNPRS